ncbi:MAG: response regulator [Candidatus Omnitrophica bacterium]|nr:response regulator [Candidatus Omnitrophota bacterium]
MERKILLIDDEEIVASTLKRNLEFDGKFNVFIESRAAEAVKTACEIKPDVILLDLVMPQLNGYQIALQLKEIESMKNVPIIFLTASVGLNENGNSPEIDSRDYVVLNKPISGEQLIHAIEAELNKN